MSTSDCWTDRRSFLKTSAAFAAIFSTPALLALPAESRESDTIIGPRKGYTPAIGTLVSMMGFTRGQVLSSTRGLTVPQLDFLLDDKANRIGALLLHLAATETYYQLNTFEGVKWGAWSNENRQKWDVPMNLGAAARVAIVGHGLEYYLSLLEGVRERTLAELRKRDDKWLMAVDEEWGWGPTNNYCKWFHVAEHESNHNGQIKLLIARLPGTKRANE